MTEPLVLLHGFTGSPASWDDVSALLPGRRIVRPTLFGHGGPERHPSSFEGEVARLATLLPDEPVHLAGYSLGARLALGLALRHPEAIRRLTLIGVHPGLSSENARAERRRADEALAELIETRGIRNFVDSWESQPLFASQAGVDAARRERKRAERLAHDPQGLAASFRATGLGEMPDLGPALSAFRSPVTLLAGELDQKFVGLARAVRERLPGAELFIAPAAGHDLLLERPDFVAEVLGRP